MEMTELKYKRLVYKELKAIKDWAMPEEINRLDFSNLKPNYPDLCIYGQMTGNCFQQRTSELLARGKTRVYFENENSEMDEVLKHFSLINPSERARGEIGVTCLEHCINKYPDNNKAIISYLKGNRKMLPKLNLN